MSLSKEERVGKLMEAFEKLPPAEEPSTITTELTTKCICGKTVAISSLEELDTGLVKTVSDVCRNCKDGARIDKELARIVCVNCKKVLCRIKPYKDSAGFTVKAGCTYHIAKCGECTPDLKTTRLLEKIVWDKKYNNK